MTRLLFFFSDSPIAEIYTLSLHDALPISFGLTLRAARDHARRAEMVGIDVRLHQWMAFVVAGFFGGLAGGTFVRSEEHTSELQSRRDLVCRLLLEKKKPSVIRKNPREKSR